MSETGAAQGVIEQTLNEIRTRVAEPRALAVRPDDRARVEKAIDRVGARFLGTTEPVLTVALAGGTGVGKSTLINALAGSAIAESSEVRPTTTKIRVYHHRDLHEGGLPQSLGADALFVAHEREELRRKVLVDTPDLDSFVIGHRALTQKLLEAAGLVLYVFSPEKYLEERTWSVLREEHRFSSCVAVLNKADRIPRHELEKLTDDLRSRFASIGIDDVRVFRVCAGAHAGSRAASVEVGEDTVDELEELRSLLEHELESGEIAQLIRSQREQSVAHLEACIAAIAPADLGARIDDAGRVAAERGAAAAEELTASLGERLEAVESELAPLATLKQHERFRGPLRTWLSVADFFRYGLTGIVARLLGGATRGDASVVRSILCRGQGRAMDDLLRAEERALQAALFERGLPIGAWRGIAGEANGEAIAHGVADEIEARFDVRAVAHSARSSVVVVGASFIGAVVPAALLGYALYRIGADFAAGQYSGWSLLGNFVGVLVMFFALLHGIVSLLLPGTRGVGRGVGGRAVHEVINGTLQGWLASYRERIDSDVEALRAPLPVLRDLAAGRGIGSIDDPRFAGFDTAATTLPSVDGDDAGASPRAREDARPDSRNARPGAGVSPTDESRRNDSSSSSDRTSDSASEGRTAGVSSERAGDVAEHDAVRGASGGGLASRLESAAARRRHVEGEASDGDDTDGGR